MILLADRRLLNAVVDSGPRLIVVGIGLVGLGLVAVSCANGRSHSERDASSLMRLETAPVLDVPSLGYIALRTGAGAALTGGCLWIGVRWFRSQPSWLPRANRAILPFYILHHPVAVAVAAVVVQWSMGLWAKLIVVLVASLAGSLALTALAMRTVSDERSSASRLTPRALCRPQPRNP